MEYEVEKILSRALLPSDLKVALLKPLKIVNAIVCQEI